MKRNPIFLDRAWFIVLGRNGSLSLRERDGLPGSDSIPVYSVNTREEGEKLLALVALPASPCSLTRTWQIAQTLDSIYQREFPCR